MTDSTSSDAEKAADLLEAALFGFGFGGSEDDGQSETDLSEDLPLVEGYRLKRLLGEGGFGQVYEAEQLAPIRRPVAMKVLRQGCSTRELLARFEQERQALALMNHPHIARIFDAGETEDGRPYIAMELVEGGTIDVAARDLGLREKVSLVRDVAKAVAHAHLKGIIHRDLKPSNLLIAEGDGGILEPKVIDFGIAKALDGPLVTGVMYTQVRQVVGTPGYMSPERLHSSQNRSAADTRADVFALGAIFWELLTGLTPMQSPDGEETRVRLPGGAAVPAELRWITEKATDAEIGRRYATAGALAEDLEAWLEGRPLVAAPRSTFYVLSKWAKRHRAMASLIAALLLAVFTLVVVLWQKNTEIRRALAESESRREERDRAAANEHYASAIMRERRRPAHALAHLAIALRHDPGNQAALGLALGTLRHQSFPRPVAPSSGYREGEVKLFAVSTNGAWAAIVTRGGGDGTTATLTRFKKGAARSTEIPLGAESDPVLLAISDSGAIAFASEVGVEIVDGDGSAVKVADPPGGLRFLAWTSRGDLWILGARELGRTGSGGENAVSRFPLPSPPLKEALSSSGGQLLVALEGGRLLLFEESEDLPREMSAPIPAPPTALALAEGGMAMAASWRNGVVWISPGDYEVESTGETVLQLRFLPGGRGLLALSPSSLRVLDPADGAVRETLTLTKPLRLLLPAGDDAILTQAAYERPVGRRIGALGEAAEWPAIEGRIHGAADASGRLLVLVDEEAHRIEWLAAVFGESVHSQGPAPREWLALSSGLEGLGWSGIDADGWVCQDAGSVAPVPMWRASEGNIRLAAVSASGETALIDLAPAPGVFVADLESGMGPLREWGKASSLALSPDGTLAVLGYPDGATAVFEVLSGERIGRRDWKRGPVTTVTFTGPDRVALAASGQVRVWDWRSDLVLPTPIDLPGTITALAPDPEGRRIAAAGEEALHVIDVETGRRLVGQLSGPAAVRALVWGRSGESAIHVFGDGGRFLLKVPPFLERAPEWLPDWIENRAGVTIDGESRLVRLRSEKIEPVPASADPALRAWLEPFAEP
jgi:serine/threonine protein kinase